MYFLNINKPKGDTSFDVIRKLRNRLKIKQIGHSGTLDPLASGVLQVGVGNCTKLLDYLSSDKTYIAEIVFGYISDTYDDEGEKTFVKTPDIKKEELQNILKTFIGKTKQVPPKFSAVKIDGKKLYSMARKEPKIEIKIPEREIEIYSIKLLDFKKDWAKIEVSCKKGTYIRSLAHDIGQKLGYGAYIKELTRTKAGNFKIEDANNLDDENLKELNPLDCLEIKKYELKDDELQKVINGNAIETQGAGMTGEILLTKNNKLVSIANLSDNKIKPKKVFWER